MPKIVLDVATSVHFYEAVLATLAIVVWYFYSVILTPMFVPWTARPSPDSARVPGIQRPKPPRPTTKPFLAYDYNPRFDQAWLAGARSVSIEQLDQPARRCDRHLC